MNVLQITLSYRESVVVRGASVCRVMFQQLIAAVALSIGAAASAAPLYNFVPLGFDDLEHTRNDGLKPNTPEKLTQSGQVSGYSRRYNGGGTDLGQSAWLFNGTTTIDIGLTGPEHTRYDGYKFSSIRPDLGRESGHTNEAGQGQGI